MTGLDLARRPEAADAEFPGDRSTSILRLQVRGHMGQVLVVVAAAAVWEVSSRVAHVGAGTVPPFTSVVVRLVTLLGDASTWDAVLHTMVGWAAGLVISTVVGSVVGLVIGASGFLARSTSFVIDVLRSVPAPALVFVLVVLLGTGYTMTVVIVVWAALWPILVQALYGARAIDPVVEDFVRAYRIAPRDVLLQVRLPSALPYITTGVKVSASVSLVVVITAEFLGGADGLGRLVEQVRQLGDYRGMYALILLTGLLGVVINEVIRVLERRVLRWHPSQRGRR